MGVTTLTSLSLTGTIQPPLLQLNEQPAGLLTLPTLIAREWSQSTSRNQI